MLRRKLREMRSRTQKEIKEFGQIYGMSHPLESTLAFILHRKAGVQIEQLVYNPDSELIGKSERNLGNTISRLINSYDIIPLTDPLADTSMLAEGSITTFNELIEYMRANKGHSKKRLEIEVQETYESIGAKLEVIKDIVGKIYQKRRDEGMAYGT